MIFRGNAFAWLWVKSLQPDKTLAWLTGLAAARKSTGFLLCWFEKSGPSCGGLKIAIGAREASGWNWWFSRQPLFRKHSANAVNKQPGFLHNLPNRVPQVFLLFHVYACVHLSFCHTFSLRAHIICPKMSINAHMRALERGCFWEAEEITPGFRGLPLPGVNSHPTLPGFSALMGFQPGLMGAKDIRQETNKKMDSLHSRLRWIYICLSCLLPFFFFAQDMHYSFQRYVDWSQLQAYLL